MTLKDLGRALFQQVALLERIRYSLHCRRNLWSAAIREPSLRHKGGLQLSVASISFGKKVSLNRGVVIFGPGKVLIESNVAIGDYTIIGAAESVSIGEGSLIAAQCYIIDSDHGIMKSSKVRDQNLFSDPVIIGRDVWLGCGVRVLKGVHIADGCIIGAGAVVTRSTVPYGIYAGVPAKKIGERP